MEWVSNKQANGLRYPLVGGTRPRHFDGTSFKPNKLPENAPTPTSRVHALLGALAERKTLNLQKIPPPTWLDFTLNFDFGDRQKCQDLLFYCYFR
jgi:hypothetical protein